MVSNNGFFDRNIANLYLYSDTGNPSTSSKFNLEHPASFSTAAVATATSSDPSPPDSGKILTFPPLILLAAELAANKYTAMSAAVTTEFTLFIGNRMYKLPNSKSSSAVSGLNLRPICRDLELTRKKFGDSSISSAALRGSRNCRTSPVGKITLAALELLMVGVIRVHEI